MVEVPDSVRALLWEYDTDALDSGHTVPDVVVERVTARGGWAEMCWLLVNQSRHELRRFLERRGRHVLPPRELSFWALASGIPESQSADWVREARARESRWRG